MLPPPAQGETFTIQSVSKPIVYAQALQMHGRDYVLQRVGVDAHRAELVDREDLATQVFEPTCTICGLDAGYQGADQRPELKECEAEFVIARRRSTYKKLDKTDPRRQLIEKAEHAKASIRSKVEHAFHVVKNLFRHRKVRYTGMAKNQGQLFTLFGLANLVIAKRSLMDLQARGAS